MKTIRWLCPSRSDFFGLGSSYRPVLYDQLFELMYYGKMGFSFSELYNMPVFLRNYYYRKLADIKKKEQEAEQAQVDKIQGSMPKRR